VSYLAGKSASLAVTGISQRRCCMWQWGWSL